MSKTPTKGEGKRLAEQKSPSTDETAFYVSPLGSLYPKGEATPPIGSRSVKHRNNVPVSAAAEEEAADPLPSSFRRKIKEVRSMVMDAAGQGVTAKMADLEAQAAYKSLERDIKGKGKALVSKGKPEEHGKSKGKVLPPQDCPVPPFMAPPEGRRKEDKMTDRHGMGKDTKGKAIKDKRKLEEQSKEKDTKGKGKVLPPQDRSVPPIMSGSRQRTASAPPAQRQRTASAPPAAQRQRTVPSESLGSSLSVKPNWPDCPFPPCKGIRSGITRRTVLGGKTKKPHGTRFWLCTVCKRTEFI